MLAEFVYKLGAYAFISMGLSDEYCADVAYGGGEAGGPSGGLYSVKEKGEMPLYRLRFSSFRCTSR